MSIALPCGAAWLPPNRVRTINPIIVLRVTESLKRRNKNTKFGTYQFGKIDIKYQMISKNRICSLLTLM